MICLLRWECLKRYVVRRGTQTTRFSEEYSMPATLYTDDGAYFIRLGNGLTIRWCRAEEGWNKSRTELPSGATQIDFADLPEVLREEVLAVLARATAVRN